jgi:hypothetical protein
LIDQVQVSPDSPGEGIPITVMADDSGNDRIFWSSTSSQLLTAEYDAYGDVLSGPQQLSASVPDYRAVTFVSLPDGSFDEVYGSGTDIYVQKYTSAAVASGSAIVVATNGSDTRNMFLLPAVKAAADQDGNLLIVYAIGTVQGQQDLDAVAVSGNGVILKAPWLVNTGLTHADQLPAVALDPSGAGIIAWDDQTLDAIVACRVSNDGLTQGAAFAAYFNPNFTARSVSAAIDDAGNITLAYEGVGGIHARRLGGDGKSDSGDYVVNTQAIDSEVQVAVNGGGWGVVVWNDPVDDEVHAQCYEPMGNVQGSPFVVPTYLDQPATIPQVAFSDDGKLAVAWYQGAVDGSSIVTDYRVFGIDMPPTFSGSTSFNLTLGSAAGTVVGTVGATDPDGESVSYQIQGTTPFAIDSTTGRITVKDAAALTSTAVASYDLTIRASDGIPSSSVNSVENVVVSMIDNAPPTLDPMPDRVADRGNPIVAALRGADAAGHPLSYSALAEPLPYWLKQQYGLYEDSTGYDQNARGGSEKYLRGKISASGYNTGGKDPWYYLLPTGDLYELDPSSSNLSGALVASLGTAFYADPTLLTSASSGTVPVTLTVRDDRLFIAPNPSLLGDFGVVATVTDGLASASRGFRVSIVVPTLSPVADQSIPNQGTTTLKLNGSDPSGAALSYSATAESLPYWLENTYGLYEDSGGYNTGARGGDEKYLRAKVSANGYNTGGQDPWYYLLPNGDLYELAPPYSSTLTGALVASLGPAVYADPTLLTAAKATSIPVTISIANNALSLAPANGLTGSFEVIASVSDGIDTAAQPFRVTVVQTPTITWANPAAIVYGTALGTAQLDATASVPGTFTYAPAFGTILHAGNAQTLSVTFTPADTTDYATATATVKINVTQATPTIAWAKPADIAAGAPLGSAQLDATASVPGIFTYAPAPGTILGAGANQPLAVTFTPFDTQDYAAASGSTIITVIASPQITGVVGASRTKQGLTSISLAFDEALDGRSVINPAFYSVLGAVKKHRKTVYTKHVGIKGISLDGNSRVTINFLKPYKGAVKLTIHGGILAANGASSSGDSSAVID